MTSQAEVQQQIREFARVRSQHDLDRDVETIIDDLAAQARSLAAGGYATDPVRTFVDEQVANGHTRDDVAEQFDRYAANVRGTYDHLEQAASNLRQAEAEGTLKKMDSDYFADLRRRVAERREQDAS